MIIDQIKTHTIKKGLSQCMKVYNTPIINHSFNWQSSHRVHTGYQEKKIRVLKYNIHLVKM